MEPRLQRAVGAAEIRFARRGGDSVPVHIYNRDPCRFLFPRPPAGDLPVAVLLTTSGGLAGGDVVGIDIAAEAGSAATVTTQAAEKLYRSNGPDCVVRCRVRVAGGASLEWLPQESIVFDGARLRRTTEIDVAAGARLLACEILVFGRAARGERYTHGLLREAWRVRRDGRLVWADALLLDGDIAATLRGRAGFDGAAACATVIAVGDDAPGLLDRARELLAPASRAGATVVGGVLLARFLGACARRLRDEVIAFLAAMRHLFMGLPAALPRVWQC